MDNSGLFRDIFQDYKKPEKDIVGWLSDLWGEYQHWAEGGDDPITRKGVEAFNKYSGIGPGMIAGGYSPAAPIKRLAKAFSMEAKGAGPQDIWTATKTQKFPWDQRYRWEIPTTEAKFTSLGEDLLLDPKLLDKAANIWDALDFPTLQKAYPELKEIKFGASAKIPGRGSFSGKDKMIGVQPYSWRDVRDPAYDPLSTTLHELQHWIQQREKFSRGYNPTGPSAVRKVFSTPEEATKYAEYAAAQKLPNIDFNVSTKTNMLGDPIVDILPNKTEYDLYNLAGGELESKAVQYRDKMRRLRFFEGEDIGEDLLTSILGQLKFNNPMATLNDIVPIANWKGLFE